MQDRSLVVNQNYRYGFNGKENDNEVKPDPGVGAAVGGEQDYGMRIYDGVIGKFLSVDPLTKQYPELTPYQFASNRPIDGVDRDGLEFFKRDNTDYSWNYQPVLKAPTVLTAANNVANNVLALVWNGTLGLALKGSQSATNYLFFDGWKPNAPNPINETIDNTFDELHKTSNYIQETPIKRQIKDVGVAFTDWSNYEIIPQLLIFHKFSVPVETQKLPFVEPISNDVIPDATSKVTTQLNIDLANLRTDLLKSKASYERLIKEHQAN